MTPLWDTVGATAPRRHGATAPAPSPRSRAHANIAAIELLARLRAATPAEQRVPAAWSGSGAVPEAFDRRDDRFAAERDCLRELLSREEYQRGEAAIPNAQRISG